MCLFCVSVVGGLSRRLGGGFFFFFFFERRSRHTRLEVVSCQRRGVEGTVVNAEGRVSGSAISPISALNCSFLDG